MGWSSSLLDDLRLDAALFSLLAYQSREYIEAAWRTANGLVTTLPPFLTSGMFQTREVHMDPRLKTLLTRVRVRPTFYEDGASGACMSVLRWRRRHDGGDVMVIAIRGTSDWDDMVCDVNVAMVPMDASEHRMDGVCVHSGFMRQLHGLRQTIDSSILAWRGDVLLVGHSLGAAVAALGALTLSMRRPAGTVAWIGVGCPRVGNTAWKDVFDSHVQIRSRVVNGRDPVPKVPLALTHGYEHVGDVHRIGEADPAPGIPNPFDLPFHVLAHYIDQLSIPGLVLSPSPPGMQGHMPFGVQPAVLDEMLPPAHWFAFLAWFSMGLMVDACSATSWFLTRGRALLQAHALKKQNG